MNVHSLVVLQDHARLSFIFLMAASSLDPRAVSFFLAPASRLWSSLSSLVLIASNLWSFSISNYSNLLVAASEPPFNFFSRSNSRSRSFLSWVPAWSLTSSLSSWNYLRFFSFNVSCCFFIWSSIVPKRSANCFCLCRFALLIAFLSSSFYILMKALTEETKPPPACFSRVSSAAQESIKHPNRLKCILV